MSDEITRVATCVRPFQQCGREITPIGRYYDPSVNIHPKAKLDFPVKLDGQVGPLYLRFE